MRLTHCYFSTVALLLTIIPNVYAQSVDINGAWTSTIIGSSGVMQDDNGTVLFTMNYKNGNSDVYTGSRSGDQLEVCAYQGIESFESCFSGIIQDPQLISMTTKSCTNKTDLDICKKIPASFDLLRTSDTTISLRGAWRLSDTQFYQISDQAGQLTLVEIDEASGDTETLSGSRTGATGQVCSDDGDGVCANIYVESSTSLRFEVVSCDSPGACDEDPIGKSAVLTKVY
jgi:hypothetical protein